jgi:hypothetical protein
MQRLDSSIFRNCLLTQNVRQLDGLVPWQAFAS